MAAAQLKLACTASGRPLPYRYPESISQRVSIVNSVNRELRLRGLCRIQAGGSSSGSDEPVDIDQLAARLAAEAEKLRRQQDQSYDVASPDDSATIEEYLAPLPPPPSEPAPFGYETKNSEGEALAAVGDGGFYASEFELLQELGQISIQQIDAAPDDALFPTAAVERSSRTAVIAYTASYFSGMPFQDPVVCLLKEYLPGAKAVACNELVITKHLCGMPGLTDKWNAASAPLSQSPPVVELLGYFLAGPSERAALADPSVQSMDVADTIWVVQKWEGMAPLALYPQQQQTSGLGLGRLFGGASAALKQRYRMLRSIARGTLRAVAYCHERNVVHGSIGSGSFLLSTFDDSDSIRLVVKLDNFGFARLISMPPSSLFPEPVPAEDTPLALGRRTDQRQLAVVLLECILSALAATGPSENTSAEAVLRVLGDVMSWDVDQFREFCAGDPDWEQAVELLSADEGAGWQLIKDLVNGSKWAEELARSPFCDL